MNFIYVNVLMYTCVSPPFHPPSAPDRDPKNVEDFSQRSRLSPKICTAAQRGEGFPVILVKSKFFSNLVVSEQKQDLLFHLDLFLSARPFNSLKENFLHFSHHRVLLNISSTIQLTERNFLHFLLNICVIIKVPKLNLETRTI